MCGSVPPIGRAMISGNYHARPTLAVHDCRFGNLFACTPRRYVDCMITQDIIRKLWDEAGYGNVAVWDDGTMTSVPVDYSTETKGKRPLLVLKPIALVNRFELLDFALNDEELLTNIEASVRAAGGTISRGPRS